jgi:hypothetical protein
MPSVLGTSDWKEKRGSESKAPAGTALPFPLWARASGLREPPTSICAIEKRTKLELVSPTSRLIQSPVKLGLAGFSGIDTFSISARLSAADAFIRAS